MNPNKNMHTSKRARILARKNVERELAQTHTHLSAGERKQYAFRIVSQAVKKLNGTAVR